MCLQSTTLGIPQPKPKGAVAAMAEDTRLLHSPGLYTRPRILIDLETKTLTARPYMARTMKNSSMGIERTERTQMTFQIVSHAKAPAMRILGGIRSINDSETITESPLTILKAPTSHGDSLMLIPSASLVVPGEPSRRPKAIRI